MSGPAGPGGGAAPSSGPPEQQLDEAAAYREWVSRMRDLSYWTVCRERRARIVGVELLPADPWKVADGVRRQAVVGGEADVKAYWSDASLELDYGKRGGGS